MCAITCNLRPALSGLQDFLLYQEKLPDVSDPHVRAAMYVISSAVYSSIILSMTMYTGGTIDLSSRRIQSTLTDPTAVGNGT